jgi:aminoglycoside 2'-N-acetyltransferase I
MIASMEVLTSHTSDLDAATLAAARKVVVEAFRGGWSDEDWEHSLGGVHAIVWEDGEVVAHGSVVQRRMLHGGRSLRTGYVEAVGVRADRRGRGHATALMQALERVIRGAYVLGALCATEQAAGLYAGLGWQLWEGPTATLTRTGVERTPDEDGAVYVLPVSAELDLTGELVCDLRDGDAW